MRTVGVEYDGLVLVVGFEVHDAIDIIEIKQFREGRIEEIGSLEKPEKGGLAFDLANSQRFRLATLYAIAAFDGQDFDPQTFRRMN